jgi:hypothetical protein
MQKYHIRTNDIVNIDYWHCPLCIAWHGCIADGNFSEGGLAQDGFLFEKKTCPYTVKSPARKRKRTHFYI